MTEKIAVVDVETTGLDPEKDRVVEIAAAIVEDGRVVFSRSEFVNPGIPIPPEASGIHHIIDDDVSGAPQLAEALDRVFGAMWNDENLIFAAHNCRFDMGFLPMTKGKPWIDTYRCAMHIWPEAPNFANQTLRYWLKIETGLPRGFVHRAKDDAVVTAHILIRLLQERDLGELMRLSTKAVVLKKVGFGKHFGKLWTEVPFDYLQWAERQDFDPDVRFTVKTEISRRRQIS